MTYISYNNFRSKLYRYSGVQKKRNWILNRQVQLQNGGNELVCFVNFDAALSKTNFLIIST
jgi:hypothetical protein